MSRAATMTLAPKRLLATKEVAAELGVSVFTVIRYVHKGLFPNVVFLNEKNIRIPRTDLNNFLLTRMATAINN